MMDTDANPWGVEDMDEIMRLMQNNMARPEEFPDIITTFAQESANMAQEDPSRVRILMATFWNHTMRRMKDGAGRDEAFNLTVQSMSTDQLHDLMIALDTAATEEAARDHESMPSPRDFTFHMAVLRGDQATRPEELTRRDDISPHACQFCVMQDAQQDSL